MWILTWIIIIVLRTRANVYYAKLLFERDKHTAFTRLQTRTYTHARTR